LPKDGGLDSLSPPKRGEGWGEGFLRTASIGLLTPTLSSLRGGEGERPAKGLIPGKCLKSRQNRKKTGFRGENGQKLDKWGWFFGNSAKKFRNFLK
jgi:hypothetical protein